jgi:uncharacterized protein with gpF-like domain
VSRLVSLPPVVHRDEHTKLLEAAVMAYFDEVLLNPLRQVLDEIGVRVNEDSGDADTRAVWLALVAGTLWYADGVFSGKFNAAISRALRAMGARKTPSGFALDSSRLPMAIRGAVAVSTHRSQQAHHNVETLLGLMLLNILDSPTGIEVGNVVDYVTEDAQEQFRRSVATVKELPPVTPVPAELKAELEADLKVQTDPAAKTFALEQAKKLREQVRANLGDGGRTDQLGKIVEAAGGVAQRKARTIADAETSLLVSKFRQRRFESVGSKSYRWETSHDEKVRPTHGESNNHRILDGRTFEWSAPPVVDAATGRRRHPGEDYGPCRCVARAILVLK